MIDASRLFPKLKQEGFDIGWVDKVVKEVVFVRSSPVVSAFERVRVYAAGRDGDAVLASVGVSVVRGRNATKGLVETELLLELAGVPSRGWTVLLTSEDMVNWENRLVEVASDRAKSIASRKGPKLITDTGTARDAALRYAELWLSYSDRHGKAGWADTMNAAQRADAYKLARWPGVVQIPGALETYEMATHCLIAFSDRIEGKSYSSCDPLRDRDLMWRIQLLVDLIGGNVAIEAL